MTRPGTPAPGAWDGVARARASRVRALQRLGGRGSGSAALARARARVPSTSSSLISLQHSAACSMQHAAVPVPARPRAPIVRCMRCRAPRPAPTLSHACSGASQRVPSWVRTGPGLGQDWAAAASCQIASCQLRDWPETGRQTGSCARRPMRTRAFRRHGPRSLPRAHAGPVRLCARFHATQIPSCRAHIRNDASAHTSALRREQRAALLARVAGAPCMRQFGRAP